MADQPEERSPVSSLKELFQQCTSQGGAAGTPQPGAHPDRQLIRNSSQGSLASGLECVSHAGLLQGGSGGVELLPPVHAVPGELPGLPQADRLLLRIGSQGSSSSGFAGLERGPPMLVQEVQRRSRGGTADPVAARPGSAGLPLLQSGTESGRAGAQPCPALGQQWLHNDGRLNVLGAHRWPLPEAAAQQQLRTGKVAAVCGWTGAADWLLQWSDGRAGKPGGWQAGGAAGGDQPPARAGQPSRGAFCFEDSLDLLLQGCTSGSAFWQGKGSPVLQELLQACSPGGAPACTEGGASLRFEASLGPWLGGRSDGTDAQQQGASQDVAAAGRTSTLQRLLMAAAAAATQGETLPGAQPAGAAAAAAANPVAAAAGWQDDFARWLQEVSAAGTAACTGAAAPQGAQMLGGQGVARHPTLAASEPLPQGKAGKLGPSAEQAARRKRVLPYTSDFMSDAEFHDILDQLFSS